MHSDAFDRYVQGHSPLHHLDPRIKLLITLGFILSNVLLPDGAWIAYGLAWAFLLGANALAQLGLGYTFRRSFIALPFALAAVTVLLLPQGHPLASFRLLAWDLKITDAGLIRFISIVIRSWLSVQMAILLVTVTQFPDLIHAFEHLHVPMILTTIITFLYRYLFVLTNEVLRLLRARQSRSAAIAGLKSGGELLWRAHVAGNLAGQLFLRSYERSDRVYHAMLARGFIGHLRTLNPHQLHARDWLYAALGFCFLILLQWIGHF
jgi:cobalt/nickel transport system permease protein